MTQTADEFLFDELNHVEQEVPEGIPRDRWKRPLIIPPGGGEPVAYTRASTMAKALDNGSGLSKWKVRMVTRGMGLDEDLAAKAAALPLLTGDRRKDGPTNALLDEYAEEAMRLAGAHNKRDWGTAVHGYTEDGRQGDPTVPARMKSDVDSYWEAVQLNGIRLVATEVFVVNDELQVAGTFDDLYYSYLYGLIVGDKKTGRENMHSVLIQMAIYANSVLYDPATGARAPLNSLCDAVDLKRYPVNLKHALYVHIPKGEGTTRFVEADIEKGYAAARLAAQVREFLRTKDGLLRDADADLERAARTEAAFELIKGASVMAELGGAYEMYKDVWTQQMTDLGNRLIEQGQINR